jgi:hypothetical protein
MKFIKAIEKKDANGNVIPKRKLLVKVTRVANRKVSNLKNRSFEA